MTYLIVVILVLFSGLFSGLTLGLLSLDKNELKRKIDLGNKKAKKVYAVRKRGNLLLCTLLLGNVAVNSTLAIFLGDIASGFMAGIIATGLIVVFGEIVPQATFSRFALDVGAKTAWLVKIFMVVFFPICWPIAKVLDMFLGEEMPNVYSKKELMKIIEEHEGSKESEVDADEERIVRGALSFSEKTCEEIMTPRTVVFAVEQNELLDSRLLNKIKQEGFTRIPVYDGKIDNTLGVLFVKDLVNIRLDTPVIDICIKEKIIEVTADVHLDDVFKRFLTTKAHMAFVKDQYGGLEGIVTLEDIIEEIINQEIMDETDKVADMQKKALKNKK